MAQIQIDTNAPELTLKDFEGHHVSLADYRGQKHIVLIFNRGFL